eukprot:gene541-681_t
MSSFNKAVGIFQALDSNNNKGALKLCQTALKKKDDPLIRVLKAIALNKLGEVEEAIKTADEIAFKGHTTDVILKNLNFFYRSVQQQEKMCRVYQISSQMNPKNEELAVGAFLAYAKVRDLKQQQQQVISLNKTFPKPTHSIWYLMTMLALAKQNPDNPLFVQMTQKMAEKLGSEGKITTREELYIYETILIQQNKYPEYLALLQGKLGDLYTVPTEKLKTLASVFTKLGRHQEAADSYREIITKYEPDEWSCYMGYFDSLTLATNEKVDYESVLGLVKTIQDSQTSSRPLRGPFIAEIEVIFRKYQSEGGDVTATTLKDLLVAYFKRFGAKPVCFYDLKKYLTDMEKKDTIEQKNTFLARLMELVSSDSTQTELRINQLSNYYKVHRFLGLENHLTEDETKKLISLLLNEYNTNKTNSQSVQQSSERVPGDDLLLICYHLLKDLTDRDDCTPQNKTRLLIEAASILEYGFQSSPRNFQFNLALIDIYIYLGAFKKVFTHYQSLSVKNIQWDTIGYLILDHSLKNGFFTECYNYFGKSNKFYSENDSTADFVATSFTNGSYSKVFEIQDFQDKVSNSHQKAANGTETQLLHFLIARNKFHNQPQQLIGQLQSIPESSYDISQSVFDRLSFNQDLGVSNEWNPSDYKPKYPYIVGSSSSSIFITNRTHDQLKNWLKLRRLVLSLLVNSQSDKFTKEKFQQYKENYQLLSSLIGQLKNSVVETTEINSDQEFDNTILDLTLNIFNFNLEINNTIQLLQKDNLESIQKIIKNIESQFNNIEKYVVKNLSVDTTINTLKPISFRLMSVFVEVSTWLSYVMSELNNILPSKKSKKKEEPQTTIRTEFDNLGKSYFSLISNFESTITAKNLSNVSISDTEISKFIQYFNINNEQYPFVNQNLIIKSIVEGCTPSSEFLQHFSSLKAMFNIPEPKSKTPQ